MRRSLPAISLSLFVLIGCAPPRNSHTAGGGGGQTSSSAGSGGGGGRSTTGSGGTSAAESTGATGGSTDSGGSGSAGSGGSGGGGESGGTTGTGGASRSGDAAVNQRQGTGGGSTAGSSAGSTGTAMGGSGGAPRGKRVGHQVVGRAAAAAQAAALREPVGAPAAAEPRARAGRRYRRQHGPDGLLVPVGLESRQPDLHDLQPAQPHDRLRLQRAATTPSKHRDGGELRRHPRQQLEQLQHQQPLRRMRADRQRHHHHRRRMPVRRQQQPAVQEQSDGSPRPQHLGRERRRREGRSRLDQSGEVEVHALPHQRQRRGPAQERQQQRDVHRKRDPAHLRRSPARVRPGRAQATARGTSARTFPAQAATSPTSPTARSRSRRAARRDRTSTPVSSSPSASRRGGSLDGQARLQPDVGGRRAHRDIEDAVLHPPGVARRRPRRQDPCAARVKVTVSRLPGLQVDALEAAQLLDRPGHAGEGVVGVQLHHLVARARAGVGDVDADRG